MKPEQWRLDLYQDLFTFAPYNADLARAFIAIEHDPIPEEDSQGRRRVEGFKLVFEGVIRKGKSSIPFKAQRGGVDMAEWTNFVGALHGAAAAYLVDTCTSGAMITISTPTFWAPPMLSGVSIDLNVQYYHPVKVGTRLQIRCEILRCTTTLANIRCDAVDADTGQVMFTGTHLKSWKAGKEEPQPQAGAGAKARL